MQQVSPMRNATHLLSLCCVDDCRVLELAQHVGIPAQGQSELLWLRQERLGVVLPKLAAITSGAIQQRQRLQHVQGL